MHEITAERRDKLPVLLTWDATGTIRQCSHVSLGSRMSIDDVLGRHVTEFGDASESLSKAMIDRDGVTARDVTWHDARTGVGGVTTCLYMRLADDATVVTMSMHLRSNGASLTPLESKVLSSLADGMSHSEVAQSLKTSESSVKATMVRVRDKLGATNTSHAVAIAVRSGLI